MSTLDGRTILMSGGSRGIRPAHTTTGNFFIDDEVLAAAGITDLSAYAYVKDADLQVDLFLDG